MKLTSSMVIAVLLLSCGAALGQTTHKLGFLSHDKQTQFCDFEQLTVTGSVVSGTHVVTSSDTCSGNNGAIAGVVSSISATSGLPVTGTVATFADNTYDQQQGYQGACGCSEFYISKLRPATAAELQAGGPFSWALYTNFGGTAALLRFGFTTTQLGNNETTSANTFDFPLPPQP